MNNQMKIAYLISNIEEYNKFLSFIKNFASGNSVKFKITAPIPKIKKLNKTKKERIILIITHQS